MDNSHWASPFLGKEILHISTIKQGVGHQLDVLTLTDNSRWVCKKYARTNWLGTVDHHSLAIAERIGATIEQTLATKVPKLQLSNSRLIRLSEVQYGLIKLYCPGSLEALNTKARSLCLGKVLAEMHQLTLKIEGSKHLPSIDWPSDLEIPEGLKPSLEICQMNRTYQAEACLDSHRDLHSGNLLWEGDYLLALLDWESAGRIHPFVELIGLASNCAGIALGQFNSSNFALTLKGYRSIRPLPQQDPILWQLVYNTWFLWLVYVYKQNQQESTIETLHSMNVLKNHIPVLRELYKKLAS